MDRGAWWATTLGHGVAESDTTERLTHNILIYKQGTVCSDELTCEQELPPQEPYRYPPQGDR